MDANPVHVFGLVPKKMRVERCTTMKSCSVEKGSIILGGFCLTDDILFYRSTGTFGFLSNLYISHVWLHARMFPSGEHAYMYAKFRNHRVAEWVMKAPQPRYVSIVGHNLFAYDITPGWANMKVKRMRAVLKSKFHPVREFELAVKLMDTGDANIIENSRSDPFWGIGSSGHGKNMLGVLLMELRSELQKENIG